MIILILPEPSPEKMDAGVNHLFAKAKGASFKCGMISQLFRSLQKFVFVGGTSGFKTDKNLRYIADT